MDENLEAISTEIVETANPTSAPEKPKKSKGLVITVIIMTIFAIAGIAAAIYFFMDANNKANDNSELKAKLDLIEAETGTELIETEQGGAAVTVVAESTDDAVKAIVSKIYDALSEDLPNQRFYRIFDGDGIIKIPNSDVYTIAEKSYGVTSGSQTNNHDEIMQKAHPIARSVLTSNGYSMVKELMFGDELYYNQNSDIYCWISMSSSPFSSDCSSGKWLSEENAGLILALAKAADTDFVSASSKDIQNSSISPYQKLTGRVANAAGLFYRVSPNAEWQFFTGTHVIVDCDKFNTEDLRKAFAGDTCWDDATGQEATIKP